MDKEQIKENIERLKLKAEFLLDKNKPTFIIDIYKNYYMGYIVLIGEEKITIDCFSPKQRKDKREYLDWVKIIDVKEYMEENK